MSVLTYDHVILFNMKSIVREVQVITDINPSCHFGHVITDNILDNNSTSARVLLKYGICCHTFCLFNEEFRALHCIDTPNFLKGE